MSQQLGRIVPVKVPSRRVRKREDRDVHNAVIEFQSPSAALLAEPVPASARGTVWVVASLVVACAIAMMLIPVDKVVTARGRLVSTIPTLVVQPLETSIVRAIDVREGQVVHKGDLLARLDPTFATADAGDSAAQVKSLSAEVDRLHAEIDGAPFQPTGTDMATTTQRAVYDQRQAAYQAKMENFQQKIDSLRASAQRSAADVQGYKQRLAVAAEMEAKRVELERLQVGSAMNTLTARDNRLEMQRGLSDSENGLQAAIRDLQAQVAERDNYVQQWRADASQVLTDEDRKLSDARQQSSKADLRHTLVDLRADQDAVVLTIAKVSVGSVLQSGDQFITLVPEDAPLEVEASVAGNDAGHVGVGDHVMIKYDTFPYVRYGYSEGLVRVMSSDSFSTDPQQQSGMRNRQLDNQNQGPGSEVFYRTRIQITKAGLHDLPRGFHMLPGMPLVADIKVGKRTVMSYLFSKILPVTAEGMREP